MVRNINDIGTGWILAALVVCFLIFVALVVKFDYDGLACSNDPLSYRAEAVKDYIGGSEVTCMCSSHDFQDPYFETYSTLEDLPNKGDEDGK